MSPARSADRNVRLYPWFQSAAGLYFWLPVFFLYFSEFLTLGQVLQLEAIYYVAVVIFELASYLSDRMGRRLTLIIASLLFIASHALFLVGGTFAVLAAAQACLAAGFAFTSGTDTALHYDSLVAADREPEYAEREALVGRYVALATALAALTGGLIAAWGLRWAYALSLIAALGQLCIAVMFVEPPAPADAEHAAATFRGQLRECLRRLRHRPLPWLFGFAACAYALNHVPYHLYQPYTDLVLSVNGADNGVNTTPLVTGLLTAAIMVIKSWAAAGSIKLRDRLGLRGVLLASLALQVGIIAICGALLHPIVLMVLLFRSVPTGLQAAPLNAAIVPFVPKAIRATYLSMQSLVGRLGYSSLLLGMSLIVGTNSPVAWEPLSQMAFAGAVVGVAAFALLAVTSFAARDR